MRPHFATLRNAANGRFLWKAIALQLVAPVVLAVATFVFAGRVNDASAIVGGASVLSGFLFGVVVYVFQLRQSLVHDPRVQRQARLPVLIDEMFSNVVYAVLVSFALTALALVIAATQEHDAAGVLVPTAPIVTAALVLLAAHLLAVVLMCMKRLRRAYEELKRTKAD